MDVTILFSGGIDSTSLIPYYLKLNYNIELLFINYGQIAYPFEFDSANKIAEHYNLSLEKIKLVNDQGLKGDIIGRNTFLISTAILYKQTKNSIISIGVHSGTNYSDCTTEFISQMQSLLNVQELLGLKIDAPFINFQKSEIWSYAKSNSVPLEHTYSCELGKNQPCNTCPSCKDLIELYEA